MHTQSLEIKKHFRSLKDPRRRHCRRHLLLDIVVIAVCAVTGGADNWEEIAAFGRRHESWFRRYLSLPNGIPSHDTFERLFSRLDPQVFQRCLRDWLLAFGNVLQCEHIAIDGKTLCGSARKTSGLGPLHLVSAWAGANHLILGQVAVEGKSNEITAIPQLLALLETKGAVVTIDAMGCQKEIAAKIRERRCHYVLAVKDNQPNLLQTSRSRLTVLMRPILRAWPMTVMRPDRSTARSPGKALLRSDLRSFRHSQSRGVGGLAGHRHVCHRTDDQRRDQGGGALLHWEPEEKRRYYASRRASTLGHREQPALANGRVALARTPTGRPSVGRRRTSPWSAGQLRRSSNETPRKGVSVQTPSGGLGP